MSCPDGSFWKATTNATITVNTCASCPRGYGTYVAEAVGAQACVDLGAFSTQHANAILLGVTWLCALAPIIASIVHHVGKHRMGRSLDKRWARAAYTIYLAQRCVLDLILCYLAQQYPATISAVTFQPLEDGESEDLRTFRRVYMGCSIVAVLLLLVCTRVLLGHTCVRRRALPMTFARQQYHQLPYHHPSASDLRVRFLRFQEQEYTFYLAALVYHLSTSFLAIWWWSKYHHAHDMVPFVANDGTRSSRQLALGLRHQTLWISAIVLSCLAFLDICLVHLPTATRKPRFDDTWVQERRQQLLRNMVQNQSEQVYSPPPRPLPPVVQVPRASAPASASIPPVVVSVPASVSASALFQSDQCIVCLDRLPEVLSVTCGHIVMCSVCFGQLDTRPRKCPACSQCIGQHQLLKRI
jgi:hypothetical protein